MTKIKRIILYSIIPLNILFFIISYKFRMSAIVDNYYEYYFGFWMLLLLISKFKISSNIFIVLSVLFYIISAVFDFIIKDSLSSFFAGFIFVLLAVALINIIVRMLLASLDKGKVPSNKVLFIANAIVGADPGVSGGESRFIEIGKEWQKKGYEIHLLGAASAGKLCEKMGLSVKLHCLTNSTKDTRLEFFIRTLLLVFYLPVLGAEYDTGVVYSTSEQMYDVLPGAFLKILYAKRIAFASAVHWLPPLLFWKRKSSKWYNSLFFMISERIGLIIAYLTTDSLLPVSNATYNDMVYAGLVNDNTTVVKCGVNLSEVTAIASKYIEKKYDGVFMKRLQSVKGIFDLIDIWSLVCSSNNNAKLEIIGSGIDEEEAKHMTTTQKLDANIKFEGVIYDFEEKYKIISQSKLFLLPSYEENWAIVIGEALATGVPVICYDLKELREVWEDSITYIKVGDKERFAEEIINILNSDDYYTKLKNKGLDFIKRYSWASIAAEELDIIKNSIM
jgi:glycosyltransferase involved in cell wall biosynthesis